MNNRKWIWLFTAVMILALVGCSKKEETTTEAPTETTDGSCRHADRPIDGGRGDRQDFL